MSPLLFILGAVGVVAAVVLISLWGERKWGLGYRRGYEVAAEYYGNNNTPRYGWTPPEVMVDEEVNRLVRGVEKEILTRRVK